MCGRYATTHGHDDLAVEFDAELMIGDDPPAPNYNIAPTDPVYAVVARRVPAAPLRRELRRVRWGLVPPWAQDPSVGSRMLNARAETLLESRAYAPAAASRRCLVPASGWYEWSTGPDGRQAYYLTPSDGSALAFAGLYEFWWRGNTALATCTIVTTAAEGDLAGIHERMPLVLPRERRADWLDPEQDDPRPLLEPVVPDLELRPVGPAVGNVANNGPQLQERYEPSALRLF